MARTVKPRDSYTKDAIALRRMMEAVQVDPTASPDWKARVNGYLHQAMSAFLERGATNANAAQQDAS
jgi:Tfp pilus assembly protein PilV